MAVPSRPRVSLCVLLVLSLASAVVLAQAEKFEGAFDADRGKLSKVKRLAIVDVTGEAKKEYREAIPQWTEDGLRHLIEAWTKSGVEIVAGPEVTAAFNEMVPIPTADQLRAGLKKKSKMSDAEIEATIPVALRMWGEEPGEAAKLGYEIHRAANTVNLERPLITEKTYGEKVKEKDVEQRIEQLREKLGVDAVAKIELGFGSWRYEEPGYVKGNRAMGKKPGLLDSIKSIKGALKGAKSTAFFNIEVYRPDGKDTILLVNGSCNSKDGTGTAITGTGDKVKAMMPAAVSGCVDNIFARINKD